MTQEDQQLVGDYLWQRTWDVRFQIRWPSLSRRLKVYVRSHPPVPPAVEGLTSPCNKAAFCFQKEVFWLVTRHRRGGDFYGVVAPEKIEDALLTEIIFRQLY